MTALLTLSLLAAQPSTVSLQIPAASAEKVIEAVAVATGRPLKASPTLGRDTLLISVTDAPVETLLQQIATTLRAEWITSDGTLILSRDSRRARQIEGEENAAIGAELKKVLSEVPEPGAAQGNDFRAGMAAARGMFGGASQSLMREIATSIDPAQLAAMGSSARRVWSTSPTRMQSAIPARLLAKATEFLDASRTERENNTGFNIDNALQRPIPAKGTRVERIVYVASKIGLGNFVTVQALLYDGQGNLLSTPTDFLTLGGPSTAKPSEWAAGKELQWSEISKAWLAQGPSAGNEVPMMGAGGGARMMFRFGGMGGMVDMSRPGLTGEARKFALNPAANEPLSLFVSEALLQSAEAHKLQLIASLPDRMVAAVEDWVEPAGKQTTKDFLAYLETESRMRFEVSDGWARLSSPTSTEDRRQYVDRRALSALFRQMEQTENLSIDVLGNYAASFGGTFAATTLDAAMASRLWTGRISVFNGLWAFNGDVLRFWGALGSGQRSALRQGGRVNIPTMTQPQRDALARLVFESFDGPNPVDANRGAPRGGGGGMRMAMPAFLQGFERTSALPNGLGDGAVVAQGRTSQNLLAKDSNGRTRVMSVQELGFSRISFNTGSGNSQMFSMNGGFTPDQFQVVPTNEIILNIQLAPNLQMSRTLNEYGFNPGAPFVKENELPRDMQRELREISERMQGAGQFRGPGGGRPTERPPI